MGWSAPLAYAHRAKPGVLSSRKSGIGLFEKCLSFFEQALKLC